MIEFEEVYTLTCRDVGVSHPRARMRERRPSMWGWPRKTAWRFAQGGHMRGRSKQSQSAGASALWYFRCPLTSAPASGFRRRKQNAEMKHTAAMA